RWVILDTTPWKEAESARVNLLRQLITAQTNERRQLSRDLHDNIGQLLTGLTLALGAVERGSTLSANAGDALALAQTVVAELRAAIHGIAHGLRVSLLDEASLGPALQQLTSDWKTRDPKVAIQCQTDNIDETRLP